MNKLRLFSLALMLIFSSVLSYGQSAIPYSQVLKFNTNYSSQKVVLQGDVYSFSVPNGTFNGQTFQIQACQDARGGHNMYGVPTNTAGTFSISQGTNACTSIPFTWNGSNWNIGSSTVIIPVYPAPSGLYAGLGVPIFSCVAPCTYTQTDANPSTSATWTILAVGGVTSTNWVLQANIGATSSVLGTIKLAGGQSSTTLSTVATTGSYPDLTNKPTLGSAAATNTTAYDPAGAATSAVASEATLRANADALLATLASPTLTGIVTVPNQTALNASTRAANTLYVDTAVGIETTRAANASNLTSGTVPLTRIPTAAATNQAATTYTLQPADCAANTPVTIFSSGTGVVITLPTSGLTTNCRARLKNLGGNGTIMTLTPATGLIDSVSSIPIVYPGDAEVFWNGTAWSLFGGNGVRGSSNVSQYGIPTVPQNGQLSTVSCNGIPKYSTTGIATCAVSGTDYALPVGTNSRMRAITIACGGSSTALTTGSCTQFVASSEYSGIITGYIITGTPSGSIVLDVRKSNGSYPNPGTSIVASAPPTMTSTGFVTSTTLTGWTTAVAVNDVFIVNVTSVSNLTSFTIQILILADN